MSPLTVLTTYHALSLQLTTYRGLFLELTTNRVLSHSTHHVRRSGVGHLLSSCSMYVCISPRACGGETPRLGCWLLAGNVFCVGLHVDL